MATAYQAAPFRLLQTCQQVLSLLRPLVEDQDLFLQLEWAPDLSPIRQGDQQKISQVLINLISNAIKFSSEGSMRLKVVPLEEECLRFEVIDCRPGYRPEAAAVTV